jgi:RPA family protein
MHVAIEPEHIVPVDAETRAGWIAETVADTRARLDAFETGDAPFGEQAREAYGEDVSGLAEAVDALGSDRDA